MYVSKLYAGTVNDYAMLKKEFPAAVHWFENKEVRVDLGFQGFATEYRCQCLRIPHKRAAKGLCNKLTPNKWSIIKERRAKESSLSTASGA